jgi:hypothetical protein
MPITGNACYPKNKAGEHLFPSTVEKYVYGEDANGQPIRADIKNSQLSNRNILINGDFRNPINQRGLTTYTAQGYAVDRWNISQLGDGKLVVNSGYVSLMASAGANRSYMHQPVEFPKLYQGMDIAVSVKYRVAVGTDLANLSFDSIISRDGVYEQLFVGELIADGQWHIFTTTYKVPSLGAIGTFYPIRILARNYDFNNRDIENNLTENVQIDIEYAKAECGKVVTQFEPTDFATELLKCQRYYCALSNVAVRLLYYGSNVLIFTLALPIQPRITPAISASGFAVYSVANVLQSGFTFTSGTSAAQSNTIRVLVSKTSHGMTDGYFYISPANKIIIDAEM